MKMKNLQLKIIAVLTVIFFTLIFFSTSKTGLSINYNFEDEVPIQNIGSQLNIAIGDVKINNIGFLTKRVNLNSYVLCSLDENFDWNFNIYYTGAKTLDAKSDMFGIIKVKSIDISSGNNIELKAQLDEYSYNLRGDIKQYKLYNTTIPLYLFKVENEDPYFYHNYCNQVQKEDAIKIIKLKLDLNEEDFTDIKPTPIK